MSSSVRKKPGLTTVVWIPNGSISGASDSIQPSTPNFDAAYALVYSAPARPASDEIVTTCPERCLRMTGRTARVTFMGPMRLTVSWRSICSGVSSSKKPASKLAALLTNTSMPPKRSTAALTAASASCPLVTSSLTTSRSSESPSASATASGLRPVATTVWPAAKAALAKSTPMPRLAPVMNQVFLSVLMALSKAPIWKRWESLSRELLAGTPTRGEPGLRLGRGDKAGDPRVPHLAPRPDHARAGGIAHLRQSPRSRTAPRGGRRPRRREHSVLHPPGARRHERRLRGRAGGTGSGAPTRRRRARSPARSGARRTPDAGATASTPRQAARPAGSPVDPRRDHRRRRVRRQRAPRHPRLQPARPRAVFPALRRPRAAGQYRPLPLPRSARRGGLRRLGPRRHRDRRDPALRRGPRPVRPRPLRPRRRARNAERGVPHPLGRAQRPLPQHRRQALQPSRRRRAPPELQPAGPRRGPRADALQLRRRARLAL